MKSQVFSEPPSLEALQKLVPELVRKQSKPELIERSLKKAGRNWVILRSLYGATTDSFYVPFDKLDKIERGWFLCAAWIDYFFKSHSRNLSLYDCLCDGLSNFSELTFQEQISQFFDLDSEKLEQILSCLPFKVSDKTIRNDFQSLAQNNWLKKEKDKYQKLPPSELPFLNFSSQANSIGNGTSHAEDEYFYFDFLNEELYDIADNYSKMINGEIRFSIFSDYIVPEKDRDRLGDINNELKQIWKLKKVPPIEIIYDSASIGKTLSYIIYPVCIYYYQRALYLCAFGQSPINKDNKDEISWYNYRLDRLRSLNKLEWSNSDIPDALKKQNQRNKLPSFHDIQEQLDTALGFDFNRESALMLLRFNADYHQRYIKDTVRHNTFKMISTVEATELIENSQETKEKKQQLLKILKNFPKDAYYKLQYRVGDNNVFMRLLAWGANVEVLLPHFLRQEIIDELRLISKIYKI
jgi:CRISPR-associated protein (TIGR03985 family)